MSGETLRILHVGKFYHPSTGGIETVLRSLAEGLVAAGHAVRVLCFDATGKGADEVVSGVRVRRLPTLGSVLSQPICPGLGRALREESLQADLVHVHSPNPLAEYLAARLPADVRVLGTYHADIQRQRLLLPLYRPLLRSFLARCARILVATDRHVAYSPVLAPFAGKCTVVPFGLDPARFAPTPAVERRAAELRATYGRFVLFVGRLVGYKGLFHLLEAMQGLDAQLVVIGEGPLAGRLRQRVQRQALGARVHLLGAVPDDQELVAFYHACRVLALPSLTPAEAFGMVLAEAMACGKPLVTSRLRSGVAWVNQDGVNGLWAEPGDAASLRGALRRVLEDDALAARLGAAGRRRFAEELTIARMVADHVDVYRDPDARHRAESRSRVAVPGPR